MSLLGESYVCNPIIQIEGVDDKHTHFSNTLRCQECSLPFTYLGLPLGITKPSLQYFLRMVQRVQRWLSVNSNFLNYGGKLPIVKSVLASLPIFYMYCLGVPVTLKIKSPRHETLLVEKDNRGCSINRACSGCMDKNMQAKKPRRCGSFKSGHSKQSSASQEPTQVLQ